MRNKKVVLTSVNKSDSKYTPEVRRAFFDKENTRHDFILLHSSSWTEVPRD